VGVELSANKAVSIVRAQTPNSKGLRKSEDQSILLQSGRKNFRPKILQSSLLLWWVSAQPIIYHLWI